MTVLMGALLALGFGLAYANGANDVSKGIATLVGSGVTSYRRAILWGAVWTGAGGLLGTAVARAMVARFGSGLFAVGTTPTLTAAMATLFGAAAWVFLATRTSLPVSTTHAMVGSIIGVGAVAYGLGGLRLSALAGGILLPLLLSPVVSLIAVTALLRLTRQRASSAARGADCICAEIEPAVPARPLGARNARSLAADAVALHITTDSSEACAAERPRALQLTLDQLHWLTSGATSFARGMNDGPKMVALVIAAVALQGPEALGRPALFALITCGMVAGSIAAGMRVTHVLAEKVTPMDHREGFIANLVTAGLVTAGATLGLPMSTTHVSSGGIFGAGIERSSLDVGVVRGIALAWIVTLPGAALLGMASYALGKLAFG